MKIVLVVGAQPNFMKVAPLLRAIAKHNEHNKLNKLNKRNKLNELNKLSITPILVHTGQHYDYEMSQIFFKDLELLQPDIYLGVGSGTHAEQTGKVMIELEKVLFKERPDLVIVVGDVNSTLAGALAAVKLCIPVAHVKAGLRSCDRTMPEEINRLLTDAISDYLFTPSHDADENLKREGIPTEKIFFVGNVMVDSLLFNKDKAEQSQILTQLKLAEEGYALLTLHRPSNVDEKDSLLKIIKALRKISRRIRIVFPAHPRTQKRLKEFDLLSHLPIANEEFLLIEPLGYLDFLDLEMNAKKVLTDSGGLQKEAYFSRVPCITFDETTGWPETVEDGWNILVGSEKDKIIEAVKRFEPKGKQRDVFGDGRAGVKIAAVIAKG
jgi:UDP-N-acetylglucosamine 2-epimerase